MGSKKRSKSEIRSLVEQARTRYSVAEGDTIASINDKARAVMAFYQSEGLAHQLEKDQPLQRCFKERGGLLTTAHAVVSEEELRAFESEQDTRLPPSLRVLVAQGGVRIFHRDPQQEVCTLSLDGMRAARDSLVGLLDLPPKGAGTTLSEDMATWRYGVSAGVLPVELRKDAKLLPLAPYYGDYGAHLVALHLRRSDGESPLFIGTIGSGSVVFYAHTADEWFRFMARLALREIDWSLTV